MAALNPVGFVLPALAVGFGALVFQPNRRGFFPFNADGEALAPIIAQATVEESSTDTLEITEHPTEVGAVVSDHSFKRPAEVTIRCAWSNSPSPPGTLINKAVGVAASIFGFPIGALAAAPSTFNAVQSILSGKGPSQINALYEQLLALQASRVPFDILTGKRQYRNMLFQSLRVDTDQATENALLVVATCREVIIVRTQLLTLDPTSQADPAKTGPTQEQGNQNMQSAPTYISDPGTVSGSLKSSSSTLNQLSTTLATSPETLNQLSGPLARLAPVINETKTAIDGVLAQLPLPQNVPVIPSAQILSIPLGTSELGTAFKDALQALPDSIRQAQVALEEASKQIPTLLAPLPASMSELSQTISGVKVTLENTTVQLEKINIR